MNDIIAEAYAFIMVAFIVFVIFVIAALVGFSAVLLSFLIKKIIAFIEDLL